MEMCLYVLVLNQKECMNRYNSFCIFQLFVAVQREINKGHDLEMSLTKCIGYWASVVILFSGN